MSYGKMPNEGRGGSSHNSGDGNKGKTNTGASTGLRKSDEMRADVMKQPSNKNPYPKGLS